MIDVIIFSKDRAAQLDLLLYSLEVNDGRGIFNEPKVLYRISNDTYAEGYDRVEVYNLAIPPGPLLRGVWGAHFQKEGDFRFDVIEAVKQCGPLFCFMVDDQILYRRPGLVYETIKRDMDIHPQAACFSLRLGENTNWQYQSQMHLRKPTFKPTEQGALLWNRNTCLQYTNYNYPLSVDGHIFRRDEILQLLEQIQFEQPNQLEARLQQFVNRMGPLMLCPPQSVLVNAAINRVQDIFQNRVGNKPEYKADAMNCRFLQNDRLSLDKTDLSNIVGCHQEIDLKWENENVEEHQHTSG